VKADADPQVKWWLVELQLSIMWDLQSHERCCGPGQRCTQSQSGYIRFEGATESDTGDVTAAKRFSHQFQRLQDLFGDLEVWTLPSLISK
jgi:hypothetical protein